MSSPIKGVLPRLSPHMIYEALLTTRSKEGEVNASPVGFMFIDEELSRFALRIYRNTRTHRNLSETGEGVLNITRNPIYFVKYLAIDKARYLAEDLESSKSVEIPRLKDMEAYIEFTVADSGDSESWTEFICRVVDAYVGSIQVTPYSRAAYALIEAAVNVSKLSPYIEQGQDVRGLIENISYCYRVIRKTAGGTEYEQSFKTLISSLPENLSSLLKEYL